MNDRRESELEFEVDRAWEIGICTCCSNSYLLQFTDGRYLYLDSWALTPFAETESFPSQKVRLTIDSQKKTVLYVQMAGPRVVKGPQLEKVFPAFDFAHSEYAIVNANELPDQWHQIVNAT